MKDCAYCGALPDTLVVETGKGDTFPEIVHTLKWQKKTIFNKRFVSCPKCFDYFIWEDVPQFYGSGWLDEELLTRLPSNESKLLVAYFDGTLEDTETFLDGLSVETARFALESCAPRFADPDRVRPFVPVLVKRIAEGDATFYSVLMHYVDCSKGAAREILAACKGQPESSPALPELIARCRKERRSGS